MQVSSRGNPVLHQTHIHTPIYTELDDINHWFFWKFKNISLEQATKFKIIYSQFSGFKWLNIAVKWWLCQWRPATPQLCKAPVKTFLAECWKILNLAKDRAESQHNRFKQETERMQYSHSKHSVTWGTGIFVLALQYNKRWQ